MKKKEYPPIEENVNQLAEPMNAYSLSDATVSEEEMDDETFDKILSTFPRMWSPSSEEEAVERIKSIEEESERTGKYYTWEEVLAERQKRHPRTKFIEEESERTGVCYDETSFWEEIKRRRYL